MARKCQAINGPVSPGIGSWPTTMPAAPASAKAPQIGHTYLIELCTARPPGASDDGSGGRPRPSEMGVTKCTLTQPGAPCLSAAPQANGKAAAEIAMRLSAACGTCMETYSSGASIHGLGRLLESL